MPRRLVQQLLATPRDLRLPHLLTHLDRSACVVLDDRGYVYHDRAELEVLCMLRAARDERKSALLTTTVVFSAWTHIFKDPMTTMVVLDRGQRTEPTTPTSTMTAYLRP